MKDFVFLGATGFDWLKAVISIVVAVIISKMIMLILPKIIFRFSKMHIEKSKSVVRSLLMPVSVLIILIGLRLALSNFPIEQYRPTVSKAYTFVALLCITWFVSNFVTAIIDGVISSKNQKEGGSSTIQMLPTIKHLVQVIIWGAGIAITLSNTGYDVKALLAGLGVGGVALALAAKNTVTNFLGGATMLIDNPFNIGDRVRVANYDGYVSFIGLRSFRLTTLDGTEVTIPNANIIDNAVENVSREPARRIVLDLSLTYDTTPEQLKKAFGILKDIAHRHDNLKDDCHVYLKNFADSSLDVCFIYFIVKGEDIFAAQSEVNVEILSRFNAEGINFAFPTRTVHVNNI
ncbi:MAG: mechanosensitive ion channel family protein [Salinivirgaceae bacterium]|nr:mechanosensitive ion channel family protein [Salinivirgaceae bacterium]